MQKLRPYQIEAIEQLRLSIQQHKRSILCVPTGGGKTTIVSAMIASAIAKGKRILFLAHRAELLSQATERLQSFGLSPGLIQGKNSKPHPFLNVASVQTLRNRTNRILPPDIIFVDECHLSMANSYRKIFDAYPKAFVVGMTATPSRLDGKPLGDVYSDIVAPISIDLLTNKSYLVPVRKFVAKEKIDLSDVHMVAGDYNANELFQKYDKANLYAGVVDNYRKFANGRQFIVFCVNVAHSKKTAQMFREAGVSCQHLDGESTEQERNTTISQFRAGLITGISNVALFTEGFDVPNVSCVILNRATKSLALYLQMIGRGLRPHPNKIDCVILDHGDNVVTHGWYSFEHEWSLHGKKKKNKQDAFSVRLCEFCEAMMPINQNVCPHCGYARPVKERTQNIIEDTEMVEITKPIIPPHLKSKPWGRMTESELKELAQIKGYKPGWVYKQLQIQKSRRA
jgi:DNA repair protein RadD